ncbi:MAG TPA: dephospho-CoA kinase, partial [Acidobacteriaceae bacterium]|nr:dephospho-CoA kinase [Acidobacteriaceae bacterium]
GKSTVARLLAERGATVLSSDEIARAMMQPGPPVFAQIVERFGPEILQPDGTLNRSALARLAFDPEHPRVDELNAIVHPAVIAEQAVRLAELGRAQPDAIVVIESALIFTVRHAPGGNWSERFDCIVVVSAPEDAKIARFIDRVREDRVLSLEERATLESDARARIAQQRLPSSERSATGPLTFALPNHGTILDLQSQVDILWSRLLALRSARSV